MKKILIYILTLPVLMLVSCGGNLNKIDFKTLSEMTPKEIIEIANETQSDCGCEEIDYKKNLFGHSTEAKETNILGSTYRSDFVPMYKEGKLFNGICETKYPNGNRKSLLHYGANGVLSGYKILFYENKNVKQIKYYSGKTAKQTDWPFGDYFISDEMNFFENGDLHQKMIHDKNGEFLSFEEYYESGKIKIQDDKTKSLGFYEDGSKSWEEIDESGKRNIWNKKGLELVFPSGLKSSSITDEILDELPTKESCLGKFKLEPQWGYDDLNTTIEISDIVGYSVKSKIVIEGKSYLPEKGIITWEDERISIQIQITDGDFYTIYFGKDIVKGLEQEQIEGSYSHWNVSESMQDNSKFYLHRIKNEDKEEVKIVNDEMIKGVTNNTTNPESIIYYKINDPDGYSNLRKEPKGDIIKKVYDTEQFEVLGEENDHKKIKMKDGTIGYIHKSRVIKN